MEELGLEKWLDLEQKILNEKINGRKFVELTAYRGVALWWFTRFRLFNPAKSTKWVRGLTRNIYMFSLADFMYDFSTSVICGAMSSFLRKNTNRKKPTVLMTVNDRDWKSLRDPTGRLKKGDIFLQSLIRELQKRGFRIVTATPLRSPITGLKTMIDRLKHQQQNLTHKEFNVYWSMKTWKMAYDARRHFRNAWKNASKNEKFVKSLEKSGLENELPYYFNSIFGYAAKCLEIAKKMVTEEKPDLILVSSEHGIIQKSLMVAGKLEKIPTIALQHGTIGHIHKGYLSWKGSISESGSIKSPYCPIPDKTAVFGPYYFHLLTETSAYPSNSVVVTGQPRYDALVMADRVYSKEVFCKNLNLDPTKKIALVATENVPIPDGKAFLTSVLKAVRNFPELQIVVKPHPAEKGKWYEEVVKEENARTVVLSKDADTYEAFYSCDLFLADFSTVVLEAIVLGKIGVTLHLGKGKDPTPFFRDVTFRVYKEEDLAPAIRKALYDENEIKKLRMAREKFVHEHTYKQDGRATERVADLVEEMIQKRQV
jgi:hypothetical protein